MKDIFQQERGESISIENIWIHWLVLLVALSTFTWVNYDDVVIEKGEIFFLIWKYKHAQFNSLNPKLKKKSFWVCHIW